MSSFENYFVRSLRHLGDEEKVRISNNQNQSGKRHKQILINPMARDPWGSLYPKSTFFQEDTSQEIIVDAEVISPRRHNRSCELSKIWILFIISIICLAIIGTLVVLLFCLPNHSTWYPVEPLDSFIIPNVTRNLYAKPIIPIHVVSNDDLPPISPVNSSGALNMEITNHPNHNQPQPVHTSVIKYQQKLPVRPSPEDPLFSWRNKIIPRADINRSPFFEQATTQITFSSTADEKNEASTAKSAGNLVPHVFNSPEAPRTRTNNRILRIK